MEERNSQRTPSEITETLTEKATQAETIEDAHTCTMCGVKLPWTEYRNHLGTREHLIKFLKFCLWIHEDPLVRDKCFVSVYCLNIEECIPAIRVQAQMYEPVQLTMRVELSSVSGNHVLLESWFFLEPDGAHRFEILSNTDDPEQQVQLSPGAMFDVNVSCVAREAGVKRAGLVFKFREINPKHEQRPFVIVRFLEVSCENELHEAAVLQPQGPYSYQPPVPLLPDAQRTVPADRLEGKPPKGRLLEQYEAPALFKRFQRHELKPWRGITSEEQAQLNDTLQQLGAPLSEQNYYKFFTTLLYLEETQMKADIRKYDMTSVPFYQCKPGIFTAEVPGIPEGRPSVIKGSSLFVRFCASRAATVTEYEGIVHKVHGAHITVSFSEEFNLLYTNGMEFDVRFTFSRVPLRLMHQALAMLKKRGLWSFVLPSCSLPSKAALKPPGLNFFNRDVGNNPEQSKAVTDMLLGLHRPYPYLLFGPPGTGKTVTLVEAMKQVCTLIPSSRLLVVAPSNSASDLLAERLVDHLTPSKILRLYSSSVLPEKMSKKLRKCSNYNASSGEFHHYTASDYKAYKVIVTTLVTSAKLVSAKLPINHFTHIIVDEAGHSLEAEALIPLMGLLSPWNPDQEGPGGHVILAGDPMQLGPIIRSRLCLSYNLGVSLLERLIKMPPYQQSDQANMHMTTKLLRNFRSHPDILKVPNEMFYSSELQASADEMISHSMLRWEELPRKGVPLLFHGVCGKDVRENNNPSYFNPDEIRVVLGYVLSLLHGKNGLRRRINECDIGIVSPYRQQVLKLRCLLHKRGHTEVFVGSTEEFQGQERLVMFVTTVRSNRELVGCDVQHNLGFLQNPKRFNVAITRAKALMVIVGNPYTLSEDACWNSILEFCISKGAYRGVPYKPTSRTLGSLDQAMSKLTLDNEEDWGDGHVVISQKTLQEEPRWRRDL